MRESDVALMTRAGPEIGVASTKAFTTQLVALRLLTLALARRRGMDPDAEDGELVDELHALPRQVEVVLQLSRCHRASMANRFADKDNALFLGRGTFYPIAMEGALKLKEISYIHAEAYPAGELKHGPLALVDDRYAGGLRPARRPAAGEGPVQPAGGARPRRRAVPVQRPKDQHRSGQIPEPHPGRYLSRTAPIVYSVPLQLLAYHVAVLKGTDVDQPRNLAKSVTVE